jgi:hypothetical protein
LLVIVHLTQAACCEPLWCTDNKRSLTNQWLMRRMLLVSWLVISSSLLASIASHTSTSNVDGPLQACQYCRHFMTHTHRPNAKWCNSGMSGPAQHVQLIEFGLSIYIVFSSNLKSFPVFVSKTYPMMYAVIILTTCDYKRILCFIFA